MKRFAVTRTSRRAVEPALRNCALVLAVSVLAGCASLSDDGAAREVSTLTQPRTGFGVAPERNERDAQAGREQVARLLSAPLTPDAAVQIALLNNRGLQTSLAQLGVSEADFVQAGRMRNPGFSFSRMRGGDEVEIERSVMFDLIGLLTIPLRSAIESGRFEGAKLSAASEAVRLAGETRRAYFNAVAAAQTEKFMRQVVTSAEAGAQLAQEQAKVGNWSTLDRAREQAFYAEAMTQYARSRHAATAARERLVRLLGVWGAQLDVKLPDRLPDLPSQPSEAGALEALAMEQRLDLQIARRDVEATARSLGLTEATGFINVLEAGYASKSSTGAPRENGYEISLELPIFDWGGARRARARATYMMSVHRTADIAIRARSEVREAYSAYRTSYDVARHYRDEVVPLKKQISEEVLLRYNGMLASVFELLADSRDQVRSVNGAIDAQRDFWIAETELQAAINGSGGAVSQSMAPGANAGPAAAAEH
ncbi:TolC family protein [Massilia sp. H6]|uniref:TolC family protein n=1 Tax=Massilia sp. H6 TaxID=2970464 RepID=UPI00216956BC|nr:TolC family protein [Massilia sp. H6]UVW27448.1 TolC family protein [Massilia sp. H6]